MKHLLKSILLLLCCFVQTAFAEDSSVEVLVKLSPVGSYVAKTSQVQGTVSFKDGKVKASNIKVQVNSLKTGIALRDKHTKERLLVKQFPEIVLISGEGTNGKGKGLIKIKGIEKPVEGTYSIKDKTISANFKISIKQFGIEKVKYLGVGVKDEVEVKVKMPITPN